MQQVKFKFKSTLRKTQIFEEKKQHGLQCIDTQFKLVSQFHTNEDLVFCQSPSDNGNNFQVRVQLVGPESFENHSNSYLPDRISISNGFGFLFWFQIQNATVVDFKSVYIETDWE